MTLCGVRGGLSVAGVTQRLLITHTVLLLIPAVPLHILTDLIVTQLYSVFCWKTLTSQNDDAAKYNQLPDNHFAQFTHSFTVVIRIIVSSKLRFRTLSNCHFEASWQLQRHTMVIFLSMKCRALWVSSVHAIHTSVCSIVEFKTKTKCRTVT